MTVKWFALPLVIVVATTICVDANESETLSIEYLISKKEELDGKEVSVYGVLIVELENIAIYADREDTERTDEQQRVKDVPDATASASERSLSRDTENLDVDRAGKLIDDWRGNSVNLRKARIILEKVLKKNPDDVHAQIEYARWILQDGYLRGDEFEAGTIERAFLMVHKAIETDPLQAKAYSVLASLQLLRGQLDAAEQSLESGGRVGSDPWLDFHEAELLKERGREKEAADMFRRVIDSNDETSLIVWSALGELAAHHVRAGRLEDAELVHREIVARFPKDAWGHGNYAYFLFWRKADFDGTVEYAQRAVVLHRYGIASQTLGYGYYGKWAQAGGGMSGNAGHLLKRARSIYPHPANVMIQTAAHVRTFPIAEALIKAGVNVDSQDHEGVTALLNAVNTDHPETLGALLALGADPELKDRRGWTPLALAAHHGKAAAVKLLLDHGADVDGSANLGQPPLWFAAAKGDVVIIDLLLAGGADINKPDDNGAIPVMAAAYYGHYDAARRLVEAGADLHEKTTYGLTASDLAAEKGHVELAAYLRERAAEQSLWRSIFQRVARIFS
ncbi:MAG TPA: ankyrin repeat domain-containing protein [Gammaproteobacteria bacterium]